MTERDASKWRKQTESAQGVAIPPAAAPSTAISTALASKTLVAILAVSAVTYSIGTFRIERLDEQGNLTGSQYDLVDDKELEGSEIAILQLEPFDFTVARQALESKGLKITHWESIPSLDDLNDTLRTAKQFWLIPTTTVTLNEEHRQAITKFFERGGSLLLWGDNDPFFADSNVLTRSLFGAYMQGNSPGLQIIRHREGRKGPGFLDHVIMCGIRGLQEGVTVATIVGGTDLEPLIYGSDGRLLAVTYERDGKRAVIDGAFTRLFVGTESTGTARYIKNVAAWLSKEVSEGDCYEH